MSKVVRHPLAKLVGLALSLACLVYFAAAARGILSGSTMSLTESPALDALPVAACLYLAAYALLAASWHCLLRAMAMNPGLPVSAGIYLSAQIAKYMPGNVGQHIGRIYLSTRSGLPSMRVGMAMLVEIVLGVAIATLLSVPLAPMVMRRFERASVPWASMAIVGLGVVVAACIVGYLLHRKRLLAPIRGHLRSALDEARSVGGSTFLAGATALTCGGTILAGLALVVLASPSLSAVTVASAVAGVALFSASWILGFLAPGAPAGLGVREAVLLGGLTPAIGGHLALEVTIVFRALSVGADLVAWLVGAMLLRRRVVKRA